MFDTFSSVLSNPWWKQTKPNPNKQSTSMAQQLPRKLFDLSKLSLKWMKSWDGILLKWRMNRVVKFLRHNVHLIVFEDVPMRIDIVGDWKRRGHIQFPVDVINICVLFAQTPATQCKDRSVVDSTAITFLGNVNRIWGILESCHYFLKQTVKVQDWIEFVIVTWVCQNPCSFY